MFNSIRQKSEVEQITEKSEAEPFEFKPIPSLKLEWKTNQYAPNKSVLIPINKKSCNNGRFDSLDDAMQYIINHCLKYYGSFKRTVAHKYIDLIEVLDPADGVYIGGNLIPNKEFNKSYTRVSKRLINKI